MIIRQKNLLTYIQALPERDLKHLTADMSQDVCTYNFVTIYWTSRRVRHEVVDSMKMLVNALMEKMGVE